MAERPPEYCILNYIRRKLSSSEEVGATIIKSIVVRSQQAKCKVQSTSIVIPVFHILYS